MIENPAYTEPYHEPEKEYDEDLEDMHNDFEYECYRELQDEEDE